MRLLCRTRRSENPPLGGPAEGGLPRGHLSDSLLLWLGYAQRRYGFLASPIPYPPTRGDRRATLVGSPAGVTERQFKFKLNCQRTTYDAGASKKEKIRTVVLTEYGFFNSGGSLFDLPPISWTAFMCQFVPLTLKIRIRILNPTETNALHVDVTASPGRWRARLPSANSEIRGGEAAQHPTTGPAARLLRRRSACTISPIRRAPPRPS